MTPVYFVVIFPASSFLPGYGYDAGGVLGCRHAITRWSTNSRSGWEGYVAGARHLEIPPPCNVRKLGLFTTQHTHQFCQIRD